MTGSRQNPQPNYAELNKALAFVILMLGVAFGIMNLQLAFSDEHQSIWLGALYGFLGFIGIFVAIFWVFDSYNTEVTANHVAKGKTQIRWEEVTDAKSNDFSMVILSGDTKVVINYYAYREPETLREKIPQLIASHRQSAP